MPEHRHTDAKVTDGQNVGPLQREHQKHMRSPDANAFDLRQVFNDFVIRHGQHAREIQIPAIGPLGHIEQV